MVPAISEEKKKSFFDRPEGTWGIILALALAAGGLWFLSWFVPFMLALGLGLWGVLILWGVPILAAIFVVTNWSSLSLAYQVFCRRLRTSIIDESPITVLEILQTRAKERLEDLGKALVQVVTARRKSNNAVTTYTDKLNRQKSRFTVAKNSGDEAESISAAAQIANLERYLADAKARADMMATGEAMLNKAKKHLEGVIRDADEDIANEKLSLEVAQVSAGAWSKISRLFKGSITEEEMRAEAMRSVVDQRERALASVDTFMTDFSEIMRKAEMDQQIDAQAVMARMNTYNFDTKDSKPAKAITNQPGSTLIVNRIRAANAETVSVKAGK